MRQKFVIELSRSSYEVHFCASVGITWTFKLIVAGWPTNGSPRDISFGRYSFNNKDDNIHK